MGGFLTYCWHRLLFNTLFGYGRGVYPAARPRPETHRVLAIPKHFKVTIEPTENHSLWRARSRMVLNGIEVDVAVIGTSPDHARQKFGQAFKVI